MRTKEEGRVVVASAILSEAINEAQEGATEVELSLVTSQHLLREMERLEALEREAGLASASLSRDVRHNWSWGSRGYRRVG